MMSFTDTYSNGHLSEMREEVASTLNDKTETVSYQMTYGSESSDPYVRLTHDLRNAFFGDESLIFNMEKRMNQDVSSAWLNAIAKNLGYDSTHISSRSGIVDA